MRPPANRTTTITRGRQYPPLTLGPERLHYQYAVTVPQLHLTLMSVLQGLAFGAIVLSVPLPDQTAQAHLFDWIAARHFYLPYIIGALVVVFIWMQFMATSLFLIWPLSTIQTLLVFSLCLAEVLTFRESEVFPAWVAGLGYIAVLGGCIYLNNLRLHTHAGFESAQAARKEKRENLLAGVFYVVIGTIVIAVGAAQDVFLSIINQATTVPVDTIILAELLFFLGIILVVIGSDARHRREQLRDVARDSDLEILPQGTLRYRDSEA